MMFIVLIIALLLRLHGINWDHNWHLHPDERMLIMVADRIHFFTQLNPDFFNYGTLPIYILKGVAQLWDTVFKTNYATYDGMLLVGRAISVALDLLIIKYIYKIAFILFSNRKAAIFSAFVYTIAFFPIQNSHFFIVDNFLNFFITATIYYVLRYLEKPTLLTVVGLAVMTAGAITTKATGILVLPLVIFVLCLPHHKVKISKNIVTSMLRLLVFGILFFIFAYLFMPYAFVFNNHTISLNPRLISDVTAQLQMNSNPFVFPYTLQYVGTIPYLYYLKNIFLWGFGPLLSILSIIGFTVVYVSYLYSIRSKKRKPLIKAAIELVHLPIKNPIALLTLCCIFYLVVFMVLGRSAVKFMRYMLPLYPFLSILAGYALSKFIGTKVPVKNLGAILFIIFLGGAFIWTMMFVQIYSHEHTRIAASRWVYENVAPTSTIAVEHWDDRLPLPLNYDQPYQFVELPLYDPDIPEKWMNIDTLLNQANYIIIASNRLYTPLMKLTDCKNLPLYRCYPITAQYYKDLFAGRKGFTKVAEFAQYPTLQIGSWKIPIDDQSADESFTVYDHPKIMIFKKNQ